MIVETKEYEVLQKIEVWIRWNEEAESAEQAVRNIAAQQKVYMLFPEEVCREQIKSYDCSIEPTSEFEVYEGSQKLLIEGQV